MDIIGVFGAVGDVVASNLTTSSYIAISPHSYVQRQGSLLLRYINTSILYLHEKSLRTNKRT